MERLFSPCTRFRDILASQGGFGDFRLGYTPELLQELNLDVSTEELLSAERAFTYADLYTMLGNRKTILWLTPHAAVVPACVKANIFRNIYNFSFSADGKGCFAVAHSSEALTEILDVFRRLLVANASEVHELALRGNLGQSSVFFNAPSFAYLVEQCQNLTALSLEKITLDEDHIRVLGDCSKPGLEIALNDCRITGTAAVALAEVLGRNQGPTKLFACYIDNSVVVNGLRGNSSLKSLEPSLSDNRDVGNREVLAIAGALRENKGLVDLNLIHAFTMNDETWYAFYNSLKAHPTLEVLDLHTSDRFGGTPLTEAVLKSQIQALLDIMKVNTSIHTVRFDRSRSRTDLYRESIVPYLETNRFRLRVHAIQKTRPITYRTKVLGRALLAVRTDPNRFWMLLSGNAEVAFPSTTATTTPVANLLSPAIAVATSNATSNATPVAATAAVTVTATHDTSATSASTAAHVATPTAHQKRKARP
jgi:hypothetical protein